MAEMKMIAKLFRNCRNQAVRIPKEFEFAASEVFLRRQGEDLLLSVRPTDWKGFLDSDQAVSNWFMTGVADAVAEAW